ncbi:MAG: thioredoxin domain-containing protein [Nitrososphaera sp.]
MLDFGEKMLVMLVADWCPFSRSFEPIFDGTDSPYVHYAVKVNEDASPLWDRFYIKAVPALAFLQDGKMIARCESRLGFDSGKGVMDSILEEL